MNTTDGLATKIEHLVREHIAEIHRTTSAAVERAFGSPASAAPRSSKTSARRAAANRREPEEVTALAERLIAAVTATPGETMAVLSKALSTTARDLNRPMTNLRRAGRLRSVGVRNQTRYFPAVGRAANTRGG